MGTHELRDPLGMSRLYHRFFVRSSFIFTQPNTTSRLNSAASHVQSATCRLFYDWLFGFACSLRHRRAQHARSQSEAQRQKEDLSDIVRSVGATDKTSNHSRFEVYVDLHQPRR